MRMFAAMRETINLAIDACQLNDDSPLDNEGPCSIYHFEDMYSRITADFSQAKLGRWLGYIQGVLCARGIVTLEELKRLNEKYAE